MVLAVCRVVSAQEPPPAEEGASRHGDDGGSHRRWQERLLYVATIAQSASDPDFITVVGADPRRSHFGTTVNRVDMPNVGDELHDIGCVILRPEHPVGARRRTETVGVAPKALGFHLPAASVPRRRRFFLGVVPTPIRY